MVLLFSCHLIFNEVERFFFQPFFLKFTNKRYYKHSGEFVHVFILFFPFFYFRSLERCLSCSLTGPPVSVFQGDTSNSESPMTPINPWFFKCVNLSIFLYCHGQYFLSILLEDSLDVKYHNYRQQMIDLYCFDNWLFQINSGR